MGHSGLETGLNERKFIVQVFIQHHKVVQPYTAIPRLTRAPLMLHATCADHHWALGKQPAKADHSSLADFDCEFIHVALCF